MKSLSYIVYTNDSTSISKVEIWTLRSFLLIGGGTLTTDHRINAQESCN